jgi:tetratricopeptide (TPR) repeat protein
MDLENDFLAAAGTLVQAQYLLKAGLVDVTARLADDAVELALKTLFPLTAELRGGRNQEVVASRWYRYRREQAEHRFGISHSELGKLHSLRQVDRFREERDGRRKLLTEPQALWSINTANRILRTLLDAPEVPPETRTRVLERLDLQHEPAPEEELLDVVEHQVGWGQYDSALKSRLIYLDRLLGSRTRSKIGRGHHTRVVTLQAHAAMNQSRIEGPEGAIELAKQAAILWEVDQQDRGRVIHVLKIQSISLREKNHPELAVPLMDLAIQIAGDDTELIDEVDSERASILLALGNPDGAARIVRDALERRRARGDALGEANYLRPEGKALMRAGQLVEAEIALRRAQELTPPDYLMAQCVLAVSLTELYATCGDKGEAHRWSETARHLIEHYGYEHQRRVLNEIIQRFPNVW